MRPYRSLELDPAHDGEAVPGPMPREEKILVAMLLVLGGFRVAVAIFSGKPFDSEATVALMGFVGGMWWGLRATRILRRRKRPER